VITGLELAGLLAAMTLSASLGALCVRRAPDTAPIQKPSLRAAVAQQRSLPKLRNMLDAQIAEYVVAEIRRRPIMRPPPAS